MLLYEAVHRIASAVTEPLKTVSEPSTVNTSSKTRVVMWGSGRSVCCHFWYSTWEEHRVVRPENGLRQIRIYNRRRRKKSSRPSLSYVERRPWILKCYRLRPSHLRWAIFGPSKWPVCTGHKWPP